MATPAQAAAAEAEANFQQVVRVVNYALEDLASLGDEWFVHDDARLKHKIKREGLGEGVEFSKAHHSSAMPPLIGFKLMIPQSTGLEPFVLWILNPDANVARNRRATIGALGRLRVIRNVKTAQVSAADY